MIPVSEWFARQRAAVFPFGGIAPSPGAALPGMLGEAGEEESASVQDDGERLYAEGVEEGRRRAEAEWETERSRWRSEAAEIEARWHRQVSENLTGQIEGAIGAISHRLETSLLAVLDRFLEEQVAQRAVNELLVMIEEALGRFGSSLLEVQAPQPLHEILREMLSAQGLSAGVIEGEAVSVVARGESVSFDLLTQRWMDQVRGIGE